MDIRDMISKLGVANADADADADNNSDANDLVTTSALLDFVRRATNCLGETCLTQGFGIGLGTEKRK